MGMEVTKRPSRSEGENSGYNVSHGISMSLGKEKDLEKKKQEGLPGIDMWGR